MNQSRRYAVVDVFTARPLLGNPVAVVLDAEGLDTETMQRIARWTNLSETTFVLPPSVQDADYRLRIFTPGSELPFAGHPTLGSAHAMLESRRIAPRQGDRLVQQCNVGLVHLNIDERGGTRRLAFELPDSKIEPLPPADVTELQHILGCSGLMQTAPAAVNVGPVWVVAHLGDAQSVISLQPDLAKLSMFERRLGITGVTVFGAHALGDAAIEVRSFAPSCGVNEDPVCGSGNGSVAAFRWGRGLLPPDGLDYVAAQGCRVGRDGRVHVSVDANGKVRVRRLLRYLCGRRSDSVGARHASQPLVICQENAEGASNWPCPDTDSTVSTRRDATQSRVHDAQGLLTAIVAVRLTRA